MVSPGKHELPEKFSEFFLILLNKVQEAFLHWQLN